MISHVDYACGKRETGHRQQGNSNSKGNEGEEHAWWFSCDVSERVEIDHLASLATARHARLTT
jgi:hypothetical protein